MHGLGSDHYKTKLGYEGVTLRGQPDIMATKNDDVDKQFQGSDGLLNRDFRKVTQKNIDSLFTKNVINDLKEKGSTTLGKLSNEYHEKVED